ncbi:MAG: CpXC domain-containing protein [Leptolyngbyaceae cyanobacterium MO_188.B28]|nr:CpXC domain-containing protein [Leptolyngbyaceae cyanobacterium MO_188.B28]
MDYSYAKATEHSCPHCHQTTTADIWLIVDQAARPELVQKIINGELNSLMCPNCGQSIGEIDRPLLVYRPSEQPPLLFSPARKTAIAEDQAHNVQALVKRLLDEIGNEDDDWVMEGLKRVHRSQLAAMLSSDSKFES